VNIAIVPAMSEMPARLEVTSADSRLVIVGEIDAHTAPVLVEHLDPLPTGDGDVVLDIAGVEFMDSSALRVLIEAHDRATTANRRLVLRGPSTAVRRLFEVSGLSEHLVID
jgi:anti-sigma B factor antagonist